MMSDSDIRVSNLKLLLRVREWSDTELALQSGYTPYQIRCWLDGYRQIDDAIARQLEVKTGLSPGSLDSTGDERAVSSSLHETRLPPSLGLFSAQAPILDGPRHRLVPMALINEIQTDLIHSNDAYSPSGDMLMSTPVVCSPFAKFIAMPDDSMSPLVRCGDHLLVDPDQAPRGGDVVVVLTPSGHCAVRMYRPRIAGEFEVVPANAGYAAIDSAHHNIQVIAVVVEHRWYRGLASNEGTAIGA